MTMKQLSAAWFGLAVGLAIQHTFDLPDASVLWLVGVFLFLGATLRIKAGEIDRRWGSPE